MERALPPAFRFLREAQARYKGVYGGRGSAKSHSCAEALVLTAAESPKRIVCGREFQNSIRESIHHLIEEKVNTLGLASRFRVYETAIEHKQTGSEFIFVGLRHNPQSIKSLEGADLFYGEEAQTFSQRSIDMLIPTVRKKGSELWFAWNPRFATDPIDVLLRGDTPPANAIVKKVTFLDNPYFEETELPAEMIEARQRDVMKFRHIWLGDYEKYSDSRVFKHWRVGTVEIPEHITPFYGADFGFSNDPLAVVKMWHFGKTLYVEKEAVQRGVGIEDHPAFFDRVLDDRKRPVIADSSRPELIHFMNSKGFRLSGAIKGKDSIKEGIAWLQDQNIVIHPSCTHTAKEIANYSYKVDIDGKTVLPDLVPGDDHAIDAMRYGVEPRRRGPVTIRKIRF